MHKKFNRHDGNYIKNLNKITEINSFTLTSDSKQKIRTNIESFVLCPCCDNKFDNDTIPKNLSCGHTICNKCIDTLKRMNNFKEKFDCPLDKEQIISNGDHLPSTSFYILQLNQQIQENIDSQEPSKFEKKIRNLAYNEMKTILLNNKYDDNLRKSYSESISSNIKKQLKELLKQEYTFSYILFLFKKDFSFSFSCSSFHYFNDEVHCHEKYEDNDWVCVTYVFIFKNSNKSLGEKEGKEIINFQKK